MSNAIANAPVGSYAVIFTNKLKAKNAPKYYEMAEKMLDLAKTQDGFLGVESARDTNLQGITVSYWRDELAIKNWKNNSDHLIAQQIGLREFYEYFHLSVAKIERTYDFFAQNG